MLCAKMFGAPVLFLVMPNVRRATRRVRRPAAIVSRFRLLLLFCFAFFFLRILLIFVDVIILFRCVSTTSGAGVGYLRTRARPSCMLCFVRLM